MKYKKRPVAVEAWKNTAGSPIPDWLQGRGTYIAGNVSFITTLEGIMRVDPEDWIIQGIRGEIYPVKDDIFQATYEAVE